MALGDDSILFINFFFLLLEETVFEDFVTAQPAASQTAAEADGY